MVLLVLELRDSEVLICICDTLMLLCLNVCLCAMLALLCTMSTFSYGNDYVIQ